MVVIGCGWLCVGVVCFYGFFFDFLGEFFFRGFLVCYLNEVFGRFFFSYFKGFRDSWVFVIYRFFCDYVKR